jgi:hypothetical protein
MLKELLMQAGSTMARAGSAYRKVVEEATGGINTGLAVNDGAPAFMARAFSLAEREDALFDLRHLTTLEKVCLPLRASSKYCTFIPGVLRSFSGVPITVRCLNFHPSPSQGGGGSRSLSLLSK